MTHWRYIALFAVGFGAIAFVVSLPMGLVHAVVLGLLMTSLAVVFGVLRRRYAPDEQRKSEAGRYRHARFEAIWLGIASAAVVTLIVYTALADGLRNALGFLALATALVAGYGLLRWRLRPHE
jgi:MFS family permease